MPRVEGFCATTEDKGVVVSELNPTYLVVSYWTDSWEGYPHLLHDGSLLCHKGSGSTPSIHGRYLLTEVKAFVACGECLELIHS